MKELYENEMTGPGRGIEMFYHTICDKYLNIRRSDASAFLKMTSLSDDKNTTS